MLPQKTMSKLIYCLLFAVLCEKGVEADSKKLNTSSAFAGNFNPFSIYL